MFFLDEKTKAFFEKIKMMAEGLLDFMTAFEGCCVLFFYLFCLFVCFFCYFFVIVKQNENDSTELLIKKEKIVQFMSHPCRSPPWTHPRNTHSLQSWLMQTPFPTTPFKLSRNPIHHLTDHSRTCRQSHRL